MFYGQMRADDKRAIDAMVLQLEYERFRRGLTQQQVAEATGVLHNQISAWERRKRVVMSLPSLIHWANALGYDLVLVPREEP